jgi:hypothetical protein
MVAISGWIRFRLWLFERGCTSGFIISCDSDKSAEFVAQTDFRYGKSFPVSQIVRVNPRRAIGTAACLCVYDLISRWIRNLVAELPQFGDEVRYMCKWR